MNEKVNKGGKSMQSADSENRPGDSLWENILLPLIHYLRFMSGNTEIGFSD